MTPKWMSDCLGIHRPRAGALREHIEGFAAILVDRGYAKFTAKQHLRLAAEVGRWLERTRIPVEDFGEAQAARFLAVRRRRSPTAARRHATLRVLLGVLRDVGAVPRGSAAEDVCDVDAIAAVKRVFRQHLDEERGLDASTCGSYLPIVGRLLRRRFGSGPVRLDGLGPKDVGRFVIAEARTRPKRMKVIVPALRVFLRWLHQRGSTRTNLAGCVPSVPDWRLTTVPKSLPPEQVEQLLASCDRTTPTGRRDYGVLLLLARLGLRAGEVVRMELGDLDWERGELLVRGKGGHQDRLPVPRDVGAALAAYLRHGRPRCSTRRVFVRATAPVRGFVTAAAIGNIVSRGLTRAGLEPPRRGAHTLRHALACTMLRRGASLTEIGQILRHRSPDTTALYAKVDFAALRTLAHAWPQPVGRP